MPKVFDGYTHYKKWGNVSKTEAEAHKKAEKSKGYYVRIVLSTGEKNKYDVWVKQSKKR